MNNRYFQSTIMSGFGLIIIGACLKMVEIPESETIIISIIMACIFSVLSIVFMGCFIRDRLKRR